MALRELLPSLAVLCALFRPHPAHAEQPPDHSAGPTASADAAPPDADEPPSPDKATTSGLSLGTGVGSDNIFFGGHVGYYVQMPNPRLRLVFHAGAGVMPFGDPDVQWGVRGGGFLAYGLRNRLVLGAYGGTINWHTYSVHGVDFVVRQNYGVGASVGWEWMHDTGLYLRCTVGPALAMTRDAGLISEHRALVWRANFFAVGYKIW